MKIETKIKKLENLLEEIRKNAKSRTPCPLAHDHYHLSQILFGVGCYQWTCKFCGKKESE